MIPKEISAQWNQPYAIYIAGGYKHLPCVNIANSYNALTFEFSLNYYYVDFNSSIHAGKNYFNFEPFSLLGILYLVMRGGDISDLEGNAIIVLGMGTFSTMGFNINVNDKFKIRPYWSFLRFSKIKGITDKLTLNAGIGTNLSYILYEDVDGAILINPFCEYGFGYSQNSPFTGFNWGLSLGWKIYY